jgi:hypothetical protein
MRLRAKDVAELAVTAPNYEFVVASEDERVWENLEVTVNDSLHLVIVRVLGEKVE